MKAKAGSLLHCHAYISYLERNVKLQLHARQPGQSQVCRKRDYFLFKLVGGKHACFQALCPFWNSEKSPAWNRNCNLVLLWVQREVENPISCSALLCNFLNCIFHKQSQPFIPSFCVNIVDFIVNRFKMVRNFHVVVKRIQGQVIQHWMGF